MPLLVLVPGGGILLSLPVLVFLEEVVESLGGPLPSALFLAHKSDFTHLQEGFCIPE